jgi:hypothetical protein
MGDMGELFNAQKAATREHRATMLAKANTDGWTQHTPYHYSRLYGPVRAAERVDWWPSGGKAMFRGKMVYGHRRVADLITKLFGQSSTKEQQA